MVFITPCPVFTVGKLHLVAVAVQGPPDAYFLDTVLHNSQRIRPTLEYLFTGARGNNMGVHEMSGFDSN
jgi:hypothetical protein